MTGLRVPRKTLISDLISGLIMAIVTVPGAVANGVLAGVNPVYGLYSMIAGTTIAALFTSSVIMNVDSTSATAIATGETVGGLGAEQQLQYLVVLGILVGLFQLLFGILKLGDLVRFISNSVMTGFLSGLGVLTILGQVGDLTGYYSPASNKVIRAADTALHFRQIVWPTLAIGLLTIALIILIERTRYARYSYAVALVVASIIPAVLNMSAVAVVGDTTEIPRSLPVPHMPDLTLVVPLLVPALAIAIIALVQAAGVSQSIPNPDGEFPDPSGDFRGQGIANVAVGFVGGIPVGGSLSGTTLIKSVGGQSRWANIFTGLFGLLMVLLFAPLLEQLPLPALAGLLVMVGFSMINFKRMRFVSHTGPVPMTIMIVTFVATLTLPIQYAVALGVIFHILLYVYQSAESVRLEQIVVTEDGAFSEGDPPATLTSNEIVALRPVGSLFFAGAAQFEEDLPDVGDAEHAVVILDLRDRTELGSTFIRAIERYLHELHAQDNLLMLADVEERALEQLDDTNLLDQIGRENIFPVEPEYGGALRDAAAAAEAWIAEETI